MVHAKPTCTKSLRLLEQLHFFSWRDEAGVLRQSHSSHTLFPCARWPPAFWGVQAAWGLVEPPLAFPLHASYWQHYQHVTHYRFIYCISSSIDICIRYNIMMIYSVAYLVNYCRYRLYNCAISANISVLHNDEMIDFLEVSTSNEYGIDLHLVRLVGNVLVPQIEQLPKCSQGTGYCSANLAGGKSFQHGQLPLARNFHLSWFLPFKFQTTLLMASSLLPFFSCPASWLLSSAPYSSGAG